ncbi:MAG: hypothetical protein ACREO3_01775, partial [Arenimonas sp.]
MSFGEARAMARIRVAILGDYFVGEPIACPAIPGRAFGEARAMARKRLASIIVRDRARADGAQQRHARGWIAQRHP